MSDFTTKAYCQFHSIYFFSDDGDCPMCEDEADDAKVVESEIDERRKRF